MEVKKLVLGLLSLENIQTEEMALRYARGWMKSNPLLKQKKDIWMEHKELILYRLT